MSQVPYMPVFTDALLGDTTHLTAAEFGSYCLIMFATWRNNGEPFADDDCRLRRIARVAPGQWARMRATLLQFFDISDGCWRQRRLEREWARAVARMERARVNATGGGRPPNDPKSEPIGPQKRISVADSCTASNPLENNEPPKAMAKPQGGLPKGKTKEDSDFKILQGELGRCAPSERRPPPAEIRAVEDRVVPPSPEQIIEVGELVDLAIAALRGTAPKGIRDGSAYLQTIKTNKFISLVTALNSWAGTHLSGAARIQAWEVLATAEAARSRAGMDPPTRRAFDQLVRMRSAADATEEAA